VTPPLLIITIGTLLTQCSANTSNGTKNANANLSGYSAKTAGNIQRIGII
jgi:hypothetical protein